MHFAAANIILLYIEFKLSFLENLSKIIILAYSFAKKRRRVFALFKSIFLRNRFLSNAWWFCSEKRKIGKGNLYLTKNQFGRNEICCAEDNHNNIRTMCEKNSQIRTLIKELSAKYRFSKNCPKFYIFTKKRNFASIIVFFRFTDFTV